MTVDIDFKLPSAIQIIPCKLLDFIPLCLTTVTKEQRVEHLIRNCTMRNGYGFPHASVDSNHETLPIGYVPHL